MAKNTSKTKTVQVPEDKKAAFDALVALLGNGQAATPTAIAEALDANKADERPAHEVLFETRGIRPAKGSTVLTPEAVKAAARVLKSGEPEAVASPEGNGDHVVLFTTDKGNVRVQNAYTPK